MNLKDKMVVITGGARGLGFAMAQALEAKGAIPVIIDLDQGQIDHALEELSNAVGYCANICDQDQVSAVFQKIDDELGALHAIINNAGITNDGLMLKKKGDVLQKMPLSEFQSVIDVNQVGTFLCAQEAAAIMIKNQCNGVIINISSISRAGNFGQSNYSASKAAVVAMATTWSKELAGFGIRAAAIAPGFIATEMTQKVPASVLDNITKKIPAGRLGQPEEIANGALFILENDYFNGRVLEIDGGLRL
jgi:3-oxoacyl-[acyl-carrier protein] reductase